MADDIRLVLSVDDRDLIRSQKEQLKYQKNLTLIEQALRNGQITGARYNAELAKQAKELSKLGGSYNKANSEVRKFAFQLRGVSDAQLNHTYQMAESGKASKRFQLGIQQAGYQVGDFAVQVASGTNWVTAFTQQGTQLVSFFGGPWGAAIGAAGAIVGAFAVYFMKASGDLKTFEQKLKDAQSAVNALSSSVESFTQEGMTKLQEKLAGTVAELNNFIMVDSKLAELKARKAVDDLLSSFLDLRKIWDKPFSEVRIGSIVALQQDLNISRGLATKLYDELEKVNKATTNQEKYQALQSISTMLDDIFGRQAKVTDEMIAFAEKVHEAEATVRQLAKTEPKASWLSSAISAADTLATKLWDAVTAKAKLEADKQKPGMTTGTPLYEQGMYGSALGLDLSGPGILGGKYPKTKDAGGGGGKSPAEQLADNLKKLQEQINLQEQLNGKTDAQRQIIQALGSDWNKVDASVLKGLEDKINAQDALNKKIEEQQNIANTLQSSMENSFMSIIDGTSSVKDAFKSLASDILKELYRVLVVQRMVGTWSQTSGTGSGIVGAIMGAFQANGGVWQGGRQVQAFANGGVVGGPTMFPMAGGKTGLMGEAGPEAIMPLKRGKDGKLGVATSGDSGAVNIVQNFSFAANGDESVKKIIAQAAPQIAKMTQQQIIDSRRRGGAMKATFG